ncbi:immunoglobulin I-set domain protein, partial [Ancylostoma duodenale]
VQWFLNGRPLKTGSRVKTINDFGFVVLEISPVYPEDSGEYSCRAVNANEQKARAVEELEEILHRRPEEVTEELKEAVPVFIEPLSAPVECEEGDRAHFTARYEPLNDNKLQVEWLRDGQPIFHSNRYRMVHDFGFAVLDIIHLLPHDTGEYTCRVSNAAGEAVSSTPIKVEPSSGLILHPQNEQKARAVEELEEILHRRPEEVTEELK